MKYPNLYRKVMFPSVMKGGSMGLCTSPSAKGVAWGLFTPYVTEGCMGLHTTSCERGLYERHRTPVKGGLHTTPCQRDVKKLGVFTKTL